MMRTERENSPGGRWQERLNGPSRVDVHRVHCMLRRLRRFFACCGSPASRSICCDALRLCPRMNTSGNSCLCIVKLSRVRKLAPAEGPHDATQTHLPVFFNHMMITSADGLYHLYNGLNR